MATALIATLALIALRVRMPGAIAVVWLCLIVGSVDTLNAIVQSMRYNVFTYPLGVNWVIVTSYVPALVVKQRPHREGSCVRIVRRPSRGPDRAGTPRTMVAERRRKPRSVAAARRFRRGVRRRGGSVPRASCSSTAIGCSAPSTTPRTPFGTRCQRVASTEHVSARRLVPGMACAGSRRTPASMPSAAGNAVRAARSTSVSGHFRTSSSDGAVASPGPRRGSTPTNRSRSPFLTALQLLPPRQRAVLIPRDVLSWRAAEVARLLGPERARGQQRVAAGSRDRLPAVRPTGSVGPRECAPTQPQPGGLLERYVRAWESADVAGLVALLREDALLTDAAATVGGWRPARSASSCATSMLDAARPDAPGRHARANGSPAFLAYANPGRGERFDARLRSWFWPTTGISWPRSTPSPTPTSSGGSGRRA